MSEWMSEEEKNKTKINWSQGKNWATNMFYARWIALYPPPPPLAQFVCSKVAYVRGEGGGMIASLGGYVKPLACPPYILFNLFVR